MNALVAKIVDRCATLTAGQTFDNPDAAGDPLTLSIHAHALPIAESPEDKAEQAPYLVVRLMGLDAASGTVSPRISILGELYTDGGVADGMADLLRLVNCLRPLTERGPGNIDGYKILPPIVWQLGDKESGNQPHPFYQFQADLRFAGV